MAADVIRTVALEPTLQNVLILGLLVLIRTFLGWSLVVEIEERWPWQPQRVEAEGSHTSSKGSREARSEENERRRTNGEWSKCRKHKTRRGLQVANQNAEGAVAPLDATQLAAERTRLAHERTLMAWIRTATSLISFGFTIYKFFQFLREQNEPSALPSTSRVRASFALLMILAGLVALVLATVQHRRDIKSATNALS